ncbi:MAG: RNA 2',3'-cyclic phosphodiesterase [Chlorobi bacterium]|nr:RNA 2',3'-cyclic phosphodiesterase [Chlorobiota bacterium]
MSDSGRVFVGLPAPAELQESVLRFARRYPALPFRWIAPEHLHVTIVPPWQCPDSGPVCMRIFETASAFAPFSLGFDTVSAGPHRRTPRLLWATAPAPSLLLSLRQALSGLSAAQQGGERGFLLHMTVARFRPEAAAGLPLEPCGVSWSGIFDRICLYESLPNPSGVTYRELCSAGFGKASAFPGN